MKIKAIILAFVFLFGGSGFSVDIAKCCSSISGISIGFSSYSEQPAEDCCKKLNPVRKKSCCSDLVFQTVINPVLGLEKTTQTVFKAGEQKIFSYTAQQIVFSLPAVQPDSDFDEFDHHYPVPILLQKRVLRI